MNLMKSYHKLLKRKKEITFLFHLALSERDLPSNSILLFHTFLTYEKANVQPSIEHYLTSRPSKKVNMD